MSRFEIFAGDPKHNFGAVAQSVSAAGKHLAVEIVLRDEMRLDVQTRSLHILDQFLLLFELARRPVDFVTLPIVPSG
ncbi:MAG: hypothetical protein ACI92S_004919 [Planctomycetaceae bacterium]|jgi:hypothetical protein